ncbi:MAG: DinB family protein [Balneolia bacterium]|nr:DinB family protein [Balneolia bacterium]
MPKKLKNPEEWKNEIIYCRNEVRRLVGSYSESEMNQRPKPDSWSAAECIEHLNLTAALMAPNLEKAVKKARERGRTGAPPFYTGWVGSWFLGGSGPKGNPLPAPGKYRPEGSRDKADSSTLDISKTAEEFDQLQQRWLDIIEDANGLKLDAVRAPSPVIPLLRLNVATWLQGMPGHQLRHLQQMRRALGDAGDEGESDVADN